MLPPIPTLQSSIKMGRNGALGTVVTLGTLEGRPFLPVPLVWYKVPPYLALKREWPPATSER